jgi:hypothetical protein
MPVAYAKGGERGPQPGDPFFELAIGKALVCVDDLLIGRAPGSRQQQLADGERIVVRSQPAFGCHWSCGTPFVRRARDP